MNDTSKATVRRYLDGFVSGGDLAVAEELVDDSVVFTSPYSPDPVHGRDGFVGMILGLRAAFPDLAIKEHALVAEGSLVAARWTASGTHTGVDFNGAPASGRRFEITGMSFYEVREGRIVAGWVNDDTLGMVTQLGLVS